MSDDDNTMNPESAYSHTRSRFFPPAAEQTATEIRTEKRVLIYFGNIICAKKLCVRRAEEQFKPDKAQPVSQNTAMVVLVSATDNLSP